MTAIDTTIRSLAEARRALLDAFGAHFDVFQSLDDERIMITAHAGRRLTVPFLIVQFGPNSGPEPHVPLSASCRLTTNVNAARSWARMDTRTEDVRKQHPDLPDQHEVRPLGTALGTISKPLVGVDNGEAPTRWYTTAQARALALELLHAADLADDAAAEAAEKGTEP